MNRVFSVLLLLGMAFASIGTSHAQNHEGFAPTITSWCNPHHSSLSIDMGAIFLAREGAAFQTELVDGGNTIFTQSLNHGFDGGFYIDTTKLLNDQWRGEFGYFGVGDWTATGRIEDPNNLTDVTADVRYEANLQSLQWNIATDPTLDTTFRLGLRYLNYSDSFDERFTRPVGVNPAINERAQGEAKNFMLGPQMGVGYGKEIGPLWIDGFLNLSLLHNSLEQSGPAYSGALTIDGVQDPRFGVEESDVTYAAEFGVNAVYPIFERLHLRVGYRGLNLDEVLESARQNGGPATRSQVDFQGASFTLLWYR